MEERGAGRAQGAIVTTRPGRSTASRRTDRRDTRFSTFLLVQSPKKGKVPIFAFLDHVLIVSIID